MTKAAHRRRNRTALGWWDTGLKYTRQDRGLRLRDRPLPWGEVAKRAKSPSFGGRVIRVEGLVHDGGSDLEHQMCFFRRPTHLLVGAHPPMQQPLQRALRGRRRYRRTVSP